MNFGRLQQAVVYLADHLAYGALGEWQRLGFEPSMAAAADLNMDVLERSLVLGNIPDVVVLVTDNADRAELLRRLKRWVRMVVLIAPAASPEHLKRNANIYVPLEQAVEPAGNADEDAVRRVLINFIANATIPYIGWSYLVNRALPQQLCVCNNDDARTFVANAVADGVLQEYDHEDEGKTVRAVKLNPENDLVQSILEDDLNL